MHLALILRVKKKKLGEFMVSTQKFRELLGAAGVRYKVGKCQDISSGALGPAVAACW